jgi:putative phosphoribosyl transferase
MVAAQRFQNRAEAGRALARKLARYAGDPNVVVLALPRGGVPVAYEVARALGAPLDVFVVRKLGAPGREELAIGALASGGVAVFDPNFVNLFRSDLIDELVRRESAELRRREIAYRDDRPPQPVEGRTVILVDDGLATGASMHAAVQGLRKLRPARIVVAVPVASESAIDSLRHEADEVVSVSVPENFYAVGPWYDDFTQTSDAEVRELLERANAH